MRIAFFDGLLETHVATSLERSLSSRGHSVLNTGKIGHGFRFETDPSRLANLQRHVDRVIEFNPDLVLVFRPASLPPHLLRRMRSSGAHLVVWLSDDPVLWDLSYRPIIDLYDTVWHCGPERVLQFYDDHFGRAVGLNVPFWTDNSSFPYVYGSKPIETAGMFLGNVQDQVRRRRYFSMGEVSANIRIHGNVGIDFQHLGGGYLDSDLEVVDAAARSSFAINVPQYFKDHRGLPTWFEGLDELGTFQYPSRIIQYAAMGLPIISVTPQPEDYETFPEIISIPDFAELDEAVKDFTRNEDLSELSRKMHERFLRNYSADSRALAIESILHDDDWRSLSAKERARWFTRFDPLEHSAPMGLEGPSREGAAQNELVTLHGSRGSTSSLMAEHGTDGLRIAVVGTGWTRPTSPISVAARALRSLGHKVMRVTPHTHPMAFVRDSGKEFHAYLRPNALLDDKNLPLDAVLFVGSSYGCTQAGRQDLDAAHVPLIYHAADSTASSIVSTKIADRADAASFSTAATASGLHSQGFQSVRYTPPLVDSEYIEFASGTGSFDPSIRVVGARRSDISEYSDLSADLSDIGAVVAVDDESDFQRATLEDVRNHLNGAVTVVAHDRSRTGVQAHELMPFAMASGTLVVSPRIVGEADIGDAGVTHLFSRDRFELTRKLLRLRSDPRGFEGYTQRARDYVLKSLLAEDHLDALLHTGARALEARQAILPDLVCDSPAPKVGKVEGKSWKLKSNKLEPARIDLELQRPQTSTQMRTDDFELRILLNGEVRAKAALPKISDSTALCITIPRGYARSSVAVELHLSRPVAQGNWKQSTPFSVSMREARTLTTASRVEIFSSSSCFTTIES